MEGLIGLMFLMGLMIYFYAKIESFLPILVIFLFSIVIGMYSFGEGIPFNPFFSLFFMLFQTIMFYLKVENKFLNRRK